MQTEAVFENIAERILKEIDKAQKSIFIAVAWFTNKNLFNLLLEKSKSGCSVSLIISNDRINQDSSIDFDLLNSKKSFVYKVGDGDKELMHNKFCIIDYSTVITGSYNWSYKANKNFENIIITYEDTFLAEQFICEFNQIRKLYFPEEPQMEGEFPIDKLVKRLEILRNYIVIEEIEDIKRESNNLKKYDFNSGIKEIIDDIKKEEFSAAINKIQNFINKNHQITFWTDPEIAALKLELKNLENQLNAYDNEKAELEKILSDFQHRHTKELGEIILEILNLRKLKYKDDKAKYEEAVNDEKEYREQVNTDIEKGILEISEQEKAELKKNFRKATVLCHPDKFVNESIDVQKQAEELFKELNEANAKNDLKRVTEILANLEKGVLTTSKGDKLADKDRLRITIHKFRDKVKQLELQILSIKESDTYKTIISIENWDEYFKQTKEKLQNQLEELLLEIDSY